MAASPATAEVVPDANCPGPVTGSVISGVDHRFAEPFTALHTGRLVRGETEIAKTGATGDYVMQILATDSAGDPTNNVLASTTIPDASVPTGDSRIAGIFAAPTNVVAGQRYAFMITRPGAELTPRDANNNPCPDAAEYESASQTAVWSGADTCCDLVFALFVELPSTLPPSNAFTLGKPKLNKRTGTATLTVEVPGPGTLVLTGKGLVKQGPAGASGAARAAAKVSAASEVKLKVLTKGKKRRTLNRTGKVKVTAKITYTPTGGAPNTKAERVKLIKRL
jgi:hypothetical protein